MGRVFAILFFLSAFGLLSAQEPRPATLAGADSSAPSTVYYNGPEVAPPVLIPFEFQAPRTHHCKKIQGTPMLSAIVDVHGVPSGFSVLRSAGPALDRAAIAYLAAERFKPGTHFSLPVPVAIEVELEMKACERTAASLDGESSLQADLRAQPAQTLEVLPRPVPQLAATPWHDLPRSNLERVGRNGVSAPVPLNTSVAAFTDAARRAHIQGICLIQLIVNTQGLPESPRVIRSIDPGLDRNALQAVMQYRFKPAMKDGQPVPVMITVEVNFRLFN